MARKREALATLKRMRKLLGPQGEHWTQGVLSEDTPEGTKYCLLGACKQADGPGENLVISLMRQEVRKIGINCSVADFNDSGKTGWLSIVKFLDTVEKEIKSLSLVTVRMFNSKSNR